MAVGLLLVVQCLQVRREVVDALRVEKLSDDVRGLERANRLDVLCNRIVEVAL